VKLSFRFSVSGRSSQLVVEVPNAFVLACDVYLSDPFAAISEPSDAGVPGCIRFSQSKVLVIFSVRCRP